MVKIDIEPLIELLAEQIKHANSMNGALDEETIKARINVRDATNFTITLLEGMGVSPDEANQKAEAICLEKDKIALSQNIK